MQIKRIAKIKNKFIRLRAENLGVDLGMNAKGSATAGTSDAVRKDGK